MMVQEENRDSTYGITVSWDLFICGKSVDWVDDFGSSHDECSDVLSNFECPRSGEDCIHLSRMIEL